MIQYTKTISQDEILYDVDFTTWKVAKCRIAETEAQAEAQTDNENYRWFIRQYDTAVEHIKNKLQAYIVPTEDDTFHFAFPDAWRGNIKALMTYIHRFIVDYILYEWFKMTLPNEAATYLASATDWEDKIINEARSEDVRNVFFRL